MPRDLLVRPDGDYMATVACSVEYEGTDPGRHKDGNDRYRRAQHAAEIGRTVKRLEIRGTQRDCSTLRKPGCEPTEYSHGTERRDERLDAPNRGDEAVDEAANRTN